MATSALKRALSATPHQLLVREMILQLKTGRLDVSYFRDKFGVNIVERFGDEFRRPYACATPVVFVHGDWDTQTPVENALEIAPYFRNGRVVIVERGGHGALSQVAQSQPKTMDALIEFLRSGKVDGLPTRIAVPAPNFPAPNFPPPKQ